MRVFHEYAQSLGSSPQDVVATIHFLNLYRHWKILQMNEMQVISQLVKHFQEHVDLPGEACQAVKP